MVNGNDTWLCWSRIGVFCKSIPPKIVAQSCTEAIDVPPVPTALTLKPGSRPNFVRSSGDEPGWLGGGNTAVYVWQFSNVVTAIQGLNFNAFRCDGCQRSEGLTFEGCGGYLDPFFIGWRREFGK